MRKEKILIVFLLLTVAGCRRKAGGDTKISTDRFVALMQEVSDGWNAGDAKMAADCFTEDVVYLEPPDQQLYEGRTALYEFFGGLEGRKEPMKMTWHYLLFDEKRQIGTGEYTFQYKGRLSHGIVIVQVHKDKIHRWREYQYRSAMQWQDFIGNSAFK